jgi:hypothetical protein
MDSIATKLFDGAKSLDTLIDLNVLFALDIGCFELV